MLTQAEIAEQERLALQRCADFEDVITQLINAGFPGTSPLIALLTRDEIIELVRVRWGELFVGFCTRIPELIVH